MPGACVRVPVDGSVGTCSVHDARVLFIVQVRRVLSLRMPPQHLWITCHLELPLKEDAPMRGLRPVGHRGVDGEALVAVTSNEVHLRDCIQEQERATLSWLSTPSRLQPE